MHSSSNIFVWLARFNLPDKYLCYTYRFGQNKLQLLAAKMKSRCSSEMQYHRRRAELQYKNCAGGSIFLNFAMCPQRHP